MGLAGLSLVSAAANVATGKVAVDDVLKIFQDSPDDLSGTAAKLEGLLEGLGPDGLKPIIIIGNLHFERLLCWLPQQFLLISCLFSPMFCR